VSAADVAGDGGGALNLAWTVSTAPDVTSQRVYRSTVSGGPYSVVVTFTNNTTNTYTDSGLTNGTTYYYVLRTFDGTQESANSAQASAVPLAATQVRQIIKGTGTTGTGATTVIDFTAGTGGLALLDLTRAFHVITYRTTAVDQHAATFKSSAITSATQLTIFGSTAVTNTAVPFEYTIIELTPTSPTVVQRRSVTVAAGQGGPGTPVTDTLPTAVVPGQTMLLSQGHSHNAAETTIGSEEFDRVRLVTGTSWEVEIGTAPNTGPQTNRVELVQWDTGMVANVQRGLTPLATTATTLTVTPPVAVDRTRTLLFVSFREGTGSALSEPPSQTGLFATLTASNQIALARQATGPALEIAWELVQFQPGVVSVQHLDIPVAAGATTTTATITSVPTAQTVALGTVATPFGYSGAQAASTTNGTINTALFTVSLDNATTARVTRGTGTGTARIGVQVWNLVP
jgi:cellulose 1,4-beta-cellobiosidase